MDANRVAGRREPVAVLRARLDQILPLDLRALSLAAGLRAAVAVATPVLVGEALGEGALSWVAIVAFWGCLADPAGAWRLRFMVLFAFTLLATLGVVLALLAEPHFAAAVTLTFAWCFAASFVRVFGAATTSVGLVLMTAVLVSLGLPAVDGREIAIRAGLTLAGGAWAMLLVLILWRLHPHGPARQAVGRCWRAIGAYADALGRLHERRDGDGWAETMLSHRRTIREAIEQARAVMARDRQRAAGLSGRAQAILALLAEAERCFEHIVAASELLEVAQPFLSPELARGLLAALRRIGQGADALGATLAASKAAPPERAARALRLLEARLAGTPEPVPLFGSIRALINEMVESLMQARAIAAGVVSPEDLAAAVAIRPEPAKPLAIVETIRENLSLESIHFRHALRLSLTVAAGEAVVAWLHLPRGYWLTMTAAITLQPFLATTWTRTLERVGGSVLGGGIAAVISVYATTAWAISILVLPLSVATLALRGVNYTLFVTCLTPLFILIAELFQGGLGSWELAGLRVLDSAMGGALGLAAAFLLWPAREEPMLRRRLAAAVTAVRRLVDAALTGDSEVQARRRSAGLACNNAEASIQRLAGEPYHPNTYLLEPAMTVLTVCRRLGGAAAAILALGRAGPARIPAAQVAWLDQSLAALSGAIEAGRSAALPVSPPADGGEDTLSRELAEIRRQVETLDDAMKRLARQEGGIR